MRVAHLLAAFVLSWTCARAAPANFPEAPSQFGVVKLRHYPSTVFRSVGGWRCARMLEQRRRAPADPEPAGRLTADRPNPAESRQVTENLWPAQQKPESLARPGLYA